MIHGDVLFFLCTLDSFLLYPCVVIIAFLYAATVNYIHMQWFFLK